MSRARLAPLHPTLPPRAPVTALNLEGYGLAFLAVLYYNWSKLQTMQQQQAAEPKPPGAAGQDAESARLLGGGSSSGSGGAQVQLASPARSGAGS